MPAFACAHPKRVQARNITAVIHNGHMLGVEALEPKDPRRKLRPLAYEMVEFCGHPCCEKVHKAVKKEEAA